MSDDEEDTLCTLTLCLIRCVNVLGMKSQPIARYIMEHTNCDTSTLIEFIYGDNQSRPIRKEFVLNNDNEWIYNLVGFLVPFTAQGTFANLVLLMTVVLYICILLDPLT